MSYLEDTSTESVQRVECRNCGHDSDQEGTQYLDSETFRWQCPKCQYENEISMPVGEPDPDYAHDLVRSGTHF